MSVLVFYLITHVGGAIANVHVAFCDTEGNAGMSISWLDSEAVSQCGTLYYGLSATSMPESVTSCDSRGFYFAKGYFHAVLSGLLFDTTYYYQINFDGVGGKFTTSRSSNSTEPFSIGMFGDLGRTYGVATRERLAILQPNLSFNVHIGDIAYSDVSSTFEVISGSEYISTLNHFMDWMNDIFDLPYMVSVGNHEADDHSLSCWLNPACSSGLSNFSAFNAMWDTPGRLERGHNMWYSFNYGPIHFVSINTETDYPGAPSDPYCESGIFLLFGGGHNKCGGFGRTPDEYINWLTADLQEANANREARPWIVVFGHRPIRDISGGIIWSYFGSNGLLSDPTLKYLIGQYADIYVAAHAHYYARFIPSATTVSSGFRPVLLTVGGAGCEEWPMRGLQNTLSGSSSDFSYFGFGDETSLGVLTLTDRFTVQWSAINSADGNVVDSLVIRKNVSNLTAAPSVVVLQTSADTTLVTTATIIFRVILVLFCCGIAAYYGWIISKRMKKNRKTLHTYGQLP